MRFFKAVFKWIFYLILLLILILVGVYFAAGFLIKTAVSNVVPPITQTTASLDDVDISLFSGRIGLQGLKIGNPAGFSDKNVFELKEIAVLFDPRSVLTDKVLIHQIKIDGVTVNAEMNMKMDSNLAVIKKNVQDFLGTEEKSQGKQVAAKASAQSSEGGKNVVIKDLTVSNVNLNPGIAAASASIPLPTIHLTNIGEKKKENVADAIATVLNKLTLESVTAFAKASKDAVVNQVKSLSKGVKDVSDSVSGGIKSLKDLF